MSKDSGCIVETKSGKVGRTYYREKFINKKIIVHVEGIKLPILCNPKTLKITGYID